jgi:hypothetical protein
MIQIGPSRVVLQDKDNLSCAPPVLDRLLPLNRAKDALVLLEIDQALSP